MDLLSRLLPDPVAVRLETWTFEPTPPAIVLALTSRRRPVACPLCGRPATRTHSRYERRLADLPWAEHGVVVRLRVRRMFCDNARCARRVFAERLPGVAPARARKTARLLDRLASVGLALGGAAGARLGRRLGLTASRNTLLRLTRRTPLPAFATPAALGVDDWAMRRHRRRPALRLDARHGASSLR